MKHLRLLFVCMSVSGMLAAQLVPPHSAGMVKSYGKLPLAFEANQGQTNSHVKFLSRGAGYSLFLTPTEAVLALQPSAISHKPSVKGNRAPPFGDDPSLTPARRGRVVVAGKLPARPSGGTQISASAALRMRLVGANAKADVIGLDELPGKSNYFIGNDPKKWRTNVRQFAKVRYGSVYPGVDLVYYGHQRELEYDFVLQPGANPQAIRIGIGGAKRLRLEHGDVVLSSAGGDVHLRSPHIYQESNGTRQQIRGRYVIKSTNQVGFEVAAYDRRRALVIDPVLAYSTYLGGSGYFGQNIGGIAVDGAGHAYVVGNTASPTFPIVNAVQPTLDGGSDAFVTKFNADGTRLVYSTFLGGSSFELGAGVAVDSAGNAYVSGYTYSTDFPTMNAIQPNNAGGQDAFVTKLNADGNALVYSTYLGGTGDDEGGPVVVDSHGDAYTTGLTTSSDFPTAHAIQAVYGGGYSDAFVTKINAAGSAFVYSTYLGGSLEDLGYGIAVDKNGNAYVTGHTASTDFPTVNAIQPAYGGGDFDGFVAKINATGSALVYSTYLGGNADDSGNGITADSAGDAYVSGGTSSANFPTVNAFQSTLRGLSNAFVTKLNAGGTALVYSTYLGGSGQDGAGGVAVDSSGNVHVTGGTTSTDFPTVNAIQLKNNGGDDVFVTKINAQGNQLIYSTYLGGRNNDDGGSIALDSAGSVYLTVFSNSTNFPITPVGFQESWVGKITSAVVKIAEHTSLSVVPSMLSFGTWTLGTTSSTRHIKVTNQATDALTINNIFIGGLNVGDFAETNTCGSTLAAGASCTVSVTFTPTTKKSRHAGLAISTPDPASPDAVALIGYATVVSLSKSKLTFGDQQVGTVSASQNVTLKNVGSTQLKFSGISITGTNAGDFSQTNTCGGSIAAGASCTITATFSPTAIGARQAAVKINDDGGSSPQQVTLTGTGT